MAVRIHAHAIDRIHQRGATPDEVIQTVERGEAFPAKFNRTGFRLRFAFQGRWREREYQGKQIEAFAVRESEDWLVITVLVK